LFSVCAFLALHDDILQYYIPVIIRRTIRGWWCAYRRIGNMSTTIRLSEATSREEPVFEAMLSTMSTTSTSMQNKGVEVGGRSLHREEEKDDLLFLRRRLNQRKTLLCFAAVLVCCVAIIAVVMHVTSSGHHDGTLALKDVEAEIAPSGHDQHNMVDATNMNVTMRGTLTFRHHIRACVVFISTIV
jgi:hypothetical protein